MKKIRTILEKNQFWKGRLVKVELLSGQIVSGKIYGTSSSFFPGLQYENKLLSLGGGLVAEA